MSEPAGDSSEQREAESYLIEKLSKTLGVPLTKRRFTLDNGSWIELDGFCESPPVLCEAWAHVGPPKGGQKHKVMNDALKLIFVKTFLKVKGECILLFADHEAALPFQNNSWMAQCLNEYNITIKIIELSPELRTKVLQAQKRQTR